MNALAIKPEEPMAISLHELLHGLIDTALLAQLPDAAVSSISLDSRRVGQNSLFLAVPGLQSHGLAHAAQAVTNGAVMVLYEPTTHALPTLHGVACIAVPQLSILLGQIADRFYHQPSAALNIAAVTGTNGKTTTAYLIASAAEHCGLTAGYSGTIGYGRIDSLKTATHTTPDVLSVHRQLAELHDEGARVVGMEVSSHALHQQRIDAVRIDSAVFTNLSRDHLDYHGSMQAYGEAKSRLFDVPGLRHRIINADDAFGRELLGKQSTAVATTAYGRSNESAGDANIMQLRASAVRLHAQGLETDIVGSYGATSLHSPLLGEFNAENLLAALAVLLGWGVPLARAAQALQQAGAPPGRMELIAANNRHAVVDYAHTPDALEKVLGVLKQHCRGQVICVFGCGGDRDRGKRASMGAIAARLADQVILTDDNPRSEDPDRIIAEIRAGMGNIEVAVQRDRALAIEQALLGAQPDDVVLIAGKGHEDYQIIGADVRHFSDREVVHAVLRSAT